MTISIRLDGNNIEGKTFQYSGGELHVELKGMYDGAKKVHVTARLQSPTDLVELALVCEVLDRYQIAEKHLIVPYFPYGRQDRVTSRGTAFSLKMMTCLVNGMGFNSVEIFDPHSDVTTALLENNSVVSQLDAIVCNSGLCQYIQKEVTAFAAPDAGAYKKALQIAAYFNKPLVTAAKKRDTATGEITGTRILDAVDGDSVLIVDDICDGGRTFTELAKELKRNGAKSVALYVTHGIFSKGFEPFSGLIDRIYSTNTFLTKSFPLPDQVPLFIHPLVR